MCLYQVIQETMISFFSWVILLPWLSIVAKLIGKKCSPMIGQPIKSAITHQNLESGGNCCQHLSLLWLLTYEHSVPD